MDRYVRESDAFFREKIDRFIALLDEYRAKGRLSVLGKYVEK
jgi:hypothetical protein